MKLGPLLTRLLDYTKAQVLMVMVASNRDSEPGTPLLRKDRDTR